MLLLPVVVQLLIAVIQFASTTSPHKRFEYKVSFKGPHLVQRDGTIPFWEHGGRKYSYLIIFKYL